MTNRDDEPDEALEREKAEVFRAFGELAAKVGTETLREALAGSFAITTDPSVGKAYDEARKEVDAFLRAKQEGVSEVREPEGFERSVEAPSEAVAELTQRLLAASDEPRH